MKRNESRLQILAAGAAAVLLLVGAPATFAGPRYGDESVTITVSQTGGRAFGGLGGVRNSANSVEYIRCEVRRQEKLATNGTVTSASAVLICSARDAEGNTAVCISSSDALAGALAGVSGDSLIDFSFVGVTCTKLQVYKSATLQLKKK